MICNIHAWDMVSPTDAAWCGGSQNTRVANYLRVVVLAPGSRIPGEMGNGQDESADLVWLENVIAVEPGSSIMKGTVSLS